MAPVRQVPPGRRATRSAPADEVVAAPTTSADPCPAAVFERERAAASRPASRLAPSRAPAGKPPLSLLLSLRTRALAPPILARNLVVNSRADLVALAGVRSLDGDLLVDAADVTESDLAALSLERITGGLRISGFAGERLPLGHLREVGGAVRIGPCPQLRSLDGFGLQRAGLFSLSDCPALESVAGLRLEDIWGMQLVRLAALESLDGLELPATLGLLSLSMNPRLYDVRALSRVERVEALLLAHNGNLIDVSPLFDMSLIRPEGRCDLVNNGFGGGVATVLEASLRAPPPARPPPARVVVLPPPERRPP